MTKPFETQTIPVISTAHITQDVNDRLDAANAPWCAFAHYIGCGYFIYLDDPQDQDDDPVPQCLLDIRDWRLKMETEGKLDNSRWVRLDCDADEVEGLPTYDW